MAGTCRVNVAPSPGDDAHGDPAAVRFGDALDQAQPEAVAVNLPIERVPAAIERLEDVRQILARRCRGRDR